MTAFWHLLRRELTTRLDLLLASLLIGLLVSTTPLLAGAHGTRALELRGVAALLVGLLWSAMLAVGLGATCLARDLGERRLAFDFRLPASATAIWGARLLGAALTVGAGSAVVLAVPALFGADFASATSGFDLWTVLATRAGDWRSPEIQGLMFLAPALLPALFLLANLAGLALFANRSWSALDLASFAGLAAALAAALGELFYWGARSAVPSVLGTAAALLLAGLLIATWLQVARGRCESGRAHRATALTLLVACLLAGGAAVLEARRLARPDWSRIQPEQLEVGPVARGLFVLEGQSRANRFLYDPRTGVALPLGPCAGGTSCGIAASADGRTIAWNERPGAARGVLPTTLHVLHGELPPAPGTATATPIDWPESIVSWDLSPDGDRVVSRRFDPATGATTVELQEIASGKTLRSLRLTECDRPGWIVFRDLDSALLSCTEPSPGKAIRGWTVLLVDLAAGAPAKPELLSFDGFHAFARLFGQLAGRQRELRAPLWPVAEGDSSPAAGPAPDAEWIVHDRESGVALARLETPAGIPLAERPRSGVFTDDGRFAGVVGRKERTRLAIWSAEGALAYVLPFPAAARVRVVGPTTDQRSVLVLWNRSASAELDLPPWSLELVDLSAGTSRSLGEHFRLRSRGLLAPDPSSVVVSLDREPGELLWFDPDTAALEPLFRGAATKTASR